MRTNHYEPSLERATVSVMHGYVLLSVADDAYADDGGWCHSLHSYEREGDLKLLAVGGNKGLLIREARLLHEKQEVKRLQKMVADDTAKLSADTTKTTPPPKAAPVVKTDG